MDRSIRECECGHCGYPLTFHNVSPDAYLCPRCALTNWIPIYKLSDTDETFLRSMRILVAEESDETFLRSIHIAAL